MSLKRHVRCSATHCNILQRTASQLTATHCNTLPRHCVTSHFTDKTRTMQCNTLQHTATHCNTLQHAATHCRVMASRVMSLTRHIRCTATHCNTLQHAATHCNTLQHTATHYNTLQHITTHCRVMASRVNSLTRHV